MCAPPSKRGGFAVTAVSEEYTHQPVDASTLRATWTARRLHGVDLSLPQHRLDFLGAVRRASASHTDDRVAWPPPSPGSRRVVDLTRERLRARR